ncbi:hypothetical protein JTE90_020251 [Oedothorax gibbosus]|uniref:Uncharacterized protein n=1 Tax=Oedothorax gibbosus TaxID=931172 RepID=A0AAV6TCU9_9ARAC|nr:hypothetical protein JTE90_020251 [Oedothorax gibbosus]
MVSADNGLLVLVFCFLGLPSPPRPCACWALRRPKVAISPFSLRVGIWLDPVQGLQPPGNKDGPRCPREILFVVDFFVFSHPLCWGSLLVGMGPEEGFVWGPSRYGFLFWVFSVGFDRNVVLSFFLGLPISEWWLTCSSRPWGHYRPGQLEQDIFGEQGSGKAITTKKLKKDFNKKAWLTD